MKSKNYKFMLLAGILCGNAYMAWAQDVVVDGLRYEISTNDNTAKLVPPPPQQGGEYAGEITIPASFTYDDQTYKVTEIDQECFYENTSVTSIVLHASVQELHPFTNCTSLKYVSLPDGITELTHTFFGCSSLEEVRLPSDLQKIGVGTFENCSGLKRFSVPGSVTEMEYSIFTNCSSLTLLTFESSPTPLSLQDEGCFKNLPIRELCIKRDLSYWSTESLWNTETLETVEVSGQATEIPSWMFNSCINLKTINIGGNVSLINSEAFAKCTALEQLTLPTSMRHIGFFAFGECAGLQRVTFQEGTTHIENSAFFNCTSLSDVQLPSTLTTIDVSVFQNSSLKSIVIPASVDSIGDSAFKGCKSLNSATLPATLRRISPNLFYECSALATVVMPEDLEVIGDDAFSSCGELASVALGGKLTTIGDGAFFECKKLKTVNYKGDIAGWLSVDILADTYPEGTNPLSYADKLILNYGTAREYTLTDLTIPEDITNIKRYAFCGYQGLTSLVVPATVKKIERSAFERCSKLARAELRTEEIGSYAFYNNSGLKEVKLGNEIKIIGAKAFDGVSPDLTAYEGGLDEWCRIEFVSESSNHFALSKQFLINGELLAGELRLPATLAQINPYAFFACQTITSVIIPENIREIGEFAFKNCRKLESISSSTTVQTRLMKQSETGLIIGEAAFEDCSFLSRIDLSQNFVSVANRAFNRTAWLEAQPEGVVYLSNLAYQYKGTMPENTTLTLKDGITGICGGAFSNQSSLVGIHLPQSLKSIGEQAFASTGLVSVSLPDQIESIGKAAFQSCSNLTSLILPEHIKSIPASMFSWCTSLNSISIPVGVETIGDYAFRFCGLKEIISFNPMPPTCESSDGIESNSETFYGVDPEECVLKIPTGSSEAYAEAAGWEKFYNKEEFDPTGISHIANDQPQGAETHYDLAGRRVNAHTKGMHLIRDAQGNIRKIWVK